MLSRVGQLHKIKVVYRKKKIGLRNSGAGSALISTRHLALLYYKRDYGIDGIKHKELQ